MSAEPNIWTCCPDDGSAYPPGHSCTVGFWDCPVCNEPGFVNDVLMPAAEELVCEDCGYEVSEPRVSAPPAHHRIRSQSRLRGEKGHA